MIDTAGWFGGPTELSEVRADHGVGGASNGATLAQVTCVRGWPRSIGTCALQHRGASAGSHFQSVPLQPEALEDRMPRVL